MFRLLVKAGDDGFNARFDWSQDEDAFAATVSGPLGIGTVRIAGDGDSVTLTDKDGAGRASELEIEFRDGRIVATPGAILRPRKLAS